VRERDRPQKYHLSLVRHVLRGVDVSGKRSLEVGSGRGGNCYYLAEYASAASVCGVDRCEGNVRLCRANPRLQPIAFVQADVERLPFADRTFEVVLSLEMSHCADDFEALLAEVHRVLVPSGVFCCADLWDLPVLGNDWDHRRALLATARFEPLFEEEDISRPVLDALRQEDGLSATIRALTTERDEFVDGLLRANDAMRLSLALSFCSYRVWRLRRS
jgi:O-methyltransferase